MLFRRDATRRLVATLLLLLVMSPACLHAEAESMRRVHTGFQLFPKILSLDLDLEKKRTSQDKIKLLFIDLNHSMKDADIRDDFFSGTRKINGRDIQLVIARNMAEVKAADAVVGMFLLHELSQEQFQAVSELAMYKQAYVFSPFVGDVERGAALGIHLTAKVLPYYNEDTIIDLNVRLHPAFFRIAKAF